MAILLLKPNPPKLKPDGVIGLYRTENFLLLLVAGDCCKICGSDTINSFWSSSRRSWACEHSFFKFICIFILFSWAFSFLA
jgi:hypothetical protein